MRKKLISGVLFFTLFSFFGVSQTPMTLSESRKESLKSILNYRYKGGFYTLEKHFNSTVKYPESARLNCRIGICVVSLKVDCEGTVQGVTIKNPLRLGIDEEVTNFFNSISNNWNTCNDDRYTRFNIPIQFTLSDTETNSTDALLIFVGECLPGQSCFGDEYYIEKAEKFMNKKNGKKAIPFINTLIKRNPYNNEYSTMKELAMSYLKE